MRWFPDFFKVLFWSAGIVYTYLLFLIFLCGTVDLADCATAPSKRWHYVFFTYKVGCDTGVAVRSFSDWMGEDLEK